MMPLLVQNLSMNAELRFSGQWQAPIKHSEDVSKDVSKDGDKKN